MPKWICPVCAASHNVTTQHLGKTAKCQKCGAANIVVDSETVASIDDDEDESSEESPADPAMNFFNKIADPDNGPSLAPAQPEQTELPTTTAIAKGLLFVLLVILFLFMLINLNQDEKTGPNPLREIAVVGFFGLLVQMVLVWPFYTACDDIHAIRLIAVKSREA
ncbi:MAG: hypothetical protein JWM11_3018 [Planctomycetaceae bacterium]|nr:hypothetical protein [Planctomycetaceae bacterium]